MPKPPKQTPTRLASAVALNAMELPADGGLPEWLMLVPAGHLVGRDGREFVNIDPDAVVAHFNAQRLPMVFDYEHGSVLLADQGHPAPASGWVVELQNRDGAVWGRIEFTDRATQMIEAREYRYYSPALLIELDKEPPAVYGLDSVGLTNKPNLDVPAINSLTPQPEHNAMDKVILLALGLSDTATADDAVAAINTLKEQRDTALNNAQTPSLEAFVPRADFDVALNRAQTAEQALADDRKAQAETAINSEIDAALEAKKITPASVEYHRAQCSTEGGLERFRKFVEAAAPVVGDTDLGERKPEQTTALNAEQKLVAAVLGKPAEVFTQAAQ